MAEGEAGAKGAASEPLTMACMLLEDGELTGGESLFGEKGDDLATTVAVAAAVGGPMAEMGDALSLDRDQSHGEAPRLLPPLLAAVMAAFASGELSLSLACGSTGPEMLRSDASLFSPPTTAVLPLPPPLLCWWATDRGDCGCG